MSYDVCKGCNSPAFRCTCGEPCAAELWNAGRPSPRTCGRCGPGPCPKGVVRKGFGIAALSLDDPEVAAMRRLDEKEEPCGEE